MIDPGRAVCVCVCVIGHPCRMLTVRPGVFGGGPMMVPAHRDRTVFRAFFLGDELLGEGTPTANLSAVAARVKASFPDALVYANEQTLAFMPGVGSAPCAGSPRCHGVAGASCCYTAGLPASIDAVSVDIYTGPLVDQSGRQRNLSQYCPSSAWQTFEAEADCVLEFYRARVYPRLSPRQQTFVVPGTFGTDADDATDQMLVRKFERFWDLAAADPRVIGLNPWHFNAQSASNSTWLNQFHAGAEQFPRLLAAMAAKGTGKRAADHGAADAHAVVSRRVRRHLELQDRGL